jgi:hypothetical protein
MGTNIITFWITTQAVTIVRNDEWTASPSLREAEATKQSRTKTRRRDEKRRSGEANYGRTASPSLRSAQPDGNGSDEAIQDKSKII